MIWTQHHLALQINTKNTNSTKITFLSIALNFSILFSTHKTHFLTCTWRIHTTIWTHLNAPFERRIKKGKKKHLSFVILWFKEALVENTLFSTYTLQTHTIQIIHFQVLNVFSCEIARCLFDVSPVFLLLSSYYTISHIFRDYKSHLFDCLYVIVTIYLVHTMWTSYIRKLLNIVHNITIFLCYSIFGTSPF